MKLLTKMSFVDPILVIPVVLLLRPTVSPDQGPSLDTDVLPTIVLVALTLRHYTILRSRKGRLIIR